MTETTTAPAEKTDDVPAGTGHPATTTTVQEAAPAEDAKAGGTDPQSDNAKLGDAQTDNAQMGNAVVDAPLAAGREIPPATRAVELAATGTVMESGDEAAPVADVAAPAPTAAAASALAPGAEAVDDGDAPVYEHDGEDDGAGHSDYEAYLASDETRSAPAAPPHAEPVRALFSDLGLSAEVLRAIDDMGYRHPTPIQEQAIPFVLMGRDVMGTAQTGTGKTAGFTLPMLDILSGSRARARMPRSLILEPTRELALQVAENFVEYGKYLKLTHALIIGGESMSDQKDVLMRGVDVLIATPGRLLDMFERGSILLTDTRILVIDEADRMLDMGFIPDVERIVSLLPKTRQTLFFSATMGPEIRRLADAFLSNPKEIAVSKPASVAATITEGLALVAEHDKREALRRLIRTQNVQNALIFCNRKRDVDILYKSLSKHKFSAGALHGDMAQTVRFQTLEKFKAGELRLLVCSDVAARGLDIGGLSHVFNFDVPIHAEDYVHRIGRTGRAGLEGHAFTIAQPEERFAVEAIEKLTGHPIPPMIVEGLDPIDWAEGDGRRRRGRAAPRKKAEARKPAERGAKERDRASREKPTVEKPASEKHAGEKMAGEEAPRDRLARDRTPRAKAPREPAPRVLNADEAAPRARAPHQRAPRPEPVPARDRLREDAPSREEKHREDHRREDNRRQDNRRDEPRRYRRDDDLGPSVVGFGDDVPAFMMLRRRTAQAAEDREIET